MIRLNFDVDLTFVEGINRLKDILGYEYGDDYIVRSQRAEKSGVKVLGNGELTKKLTVKAAKFSKSAEAAITAKGGSIEVI